MVIEKSSGEKHIGQGMVSMVVPCYNMEKYLTRTFQSIYNQKWDNVELILVNDGSTDKTPEIIEEWVPKFKKRGYVPVVLHQQNQGLAVSVKNGMQRISGKYFCTVDADDELHPEYISTMAGFLDENEDYEWARCGVSTVGKTPDGKTIIKPIVAQTNADDPNALVNFLLWRMLKSACYFLIRTRYLRACKVIDNYVTAKDYSQEPQIAMPLFVGGKPIKIFNESLYFNHLSENSMSRGNTVENQLTHANAYVESVKETIKTLQLDAVTKNKLLSLTGWLTLRKERQILERTQCPNEWKEENTKKIIDFINTHVEPCPNITPQDLLGVELPILYAAFESCVLEDILFFPPSEGRIIGYGALGKLAGRLLPTLVKTPLRPHVLWDKAAEGGETREGIPVTLPDFESITDADMVLIFPAAVTKEDFIEMAGINKVHSIINYKELFQYAAKMTFPQITLGKYVF